MLEFEHATTLDTHEIGGRVFDAVYCMGGGYGPRLVTLDRHLRGELPADLDPTMLHMRDEFRPAIEMTLHGVYREIRDAVIDSGMAHGVAEGCDRLAETLLEKLRTPGAFGPDVKVLDPEVKVAEDAPLQDRLLGLLGRDPS